MNDPGNLLVLDGRPFEPLEPRLVLSTSLVGRAADILDVGGRGLGASVIVGDFNGDGLDDIATWGNRTLRYAMGQGERSFGPSRSMIFRELIQSLAVGDVNGDGRDDLAVGFSAVQRQVRLLLGAGGDRLDRAGITPVSPGEFTLLDTDGDGDDELLVRSVHTDTQTATFTRYAAVEGEWVAAGSFERATGTENLRSSFLIDDVTGDGRDDAFMLTGSYNDPPASSAAGVAWVLAGGTWGDSEPHVTIQGIGDYGAPALGDLDVDGDADLAIVRSHIYNDDNNGTVRTFMSESDGHTGVTFALPVEIGAYRSRLPYLGGYPPEPISVRIVDADGDDTPEVLLLTAELYSPASRASATDLVLRKFELTGDPLAEGHILRVEVFSQDWADLDHDGYPDLLGVTGEVFSGLYGSGSTYEIDSVGVHWNTPDNKPPVISRRVTTSFTGRNADAMARFDVRALDQDDSRGGRVVVVTFWADTNNNGELDPDDRRLGIDDNPDDGWAIQIAPYQPWARSARAVFARATDDQGELSTVSTTRYTNPLPRFYLGTDAPAGDNANPPRLVAVINLPGVAVAKAEFWRDTNGNRQLDSGDRRLGIDTDAADGWGVTIAARAAWAMTPTYVFGRITDVRGRQSDLVAGRYANPHPVPGTITIDGAPDSVQVGQTVRLTSRGVFDPDRTFAGDWVYRYLFYIDTDHDGRITAADTRIGAGKAGDFGRRWWIDATVNDAWSAAAIDGRVTLLGTALDTSNLRSWRPASVTVRVTS